MTEQTAIEETTVEDIQDLTNVNVSSTPATTEEVPKWRQERDAHGQESVAQKIGNITRPAVLVKPDNGKQPHIRMSMAVNRGEDQESSFLTVYIYGGKESAEASDDTKPSVEELQAFADGLKQGRVKVQGKHDVRPSRDLADKLRSALGVAADDRTNEFVNALYFGGQESITVFVKRDQLDLEASFNNAKSYDPIKLLPLIGDGTGSSSPKTPW